jgi:hypothetical protein
VFHVIYTLTTVPFLSLDGPHTEEQPSFWSVNKRNSLLNVQQYTILNVFEETKWNYLALMCMSKNEKNIVEIHEKNVSYVIEYKIPFFV